MLTSAREIIEFWLGDATHSPDAVEAQTERWYAGGDALDREIKSRFGDLLAAAEKGELDAWRGDADGELALVILLDQFSRNVYRGTADVWKNDPLALEITQECVASGRHLELSLMERVFLYHAYHHAEDRQAQQACVDWYTQVYNEADDVWKEVLKGFLDYAGGHAAIVQEYGRFPHRNETLGRASTPAEVDYLSKNKQRYGQ